MALLTNLQEEEGKEEKAEVVARTVGEEGKGVTWSCF